MATHGLLSEGRAMFRLLALTLGAVVTLSAVPAKATEVADAEIDRLVQALVNPDSKVRQKAAQELSKLGPKAEAAIPALARIIDPSNPNIKTRESANRVLWAGTALY